MIPNPPPDVQEDPQALAAAEVPAEQPPVAPAPPAPPVQVPETPPPPDTATVQAHQAVAHLAGQEQRLVQAAHALQTQEQAAANSIAPVLQALQTGQISQEQAAPLLAQYNADRQQREQQAQALKAGHDELQHLKVQAAYQLQDLQRRSTLEPFAKKMGIDLVAEEAAQQSGDPENFPKARLKKQLERVPPDAWRAVQAASVEDYRDQRLTARAAAGTDEMGGTGTGAAPDTGGSAKDDIMAGLRQLYG